jgi:predicted dithiol-disulfide oxidoreductase (DUF899 family)
MTIRTVSREDWLNERKALLEREKEFTRARDTLSAARRDLPWVQVEENYRFHGKDGEASLADLFDGKSQLIVYHFMYGTDWQEGCKSCSFWIDNFEGVAAHLAARDTALVLISKGPLDRLLAFRNRMGWSLPWLSAETTDFNEDYGVTFSQEDMDAGEVTYNFRQTKIGSAELPGISVFAKREDGAIYHTYSTYSRGLDMMNSAYHLLDLTPLGRNEDDLPFTMSWLKRHDEY